MNKITINKAFQKYFDQIIWKIEVDSAHRLLGVETRDPSSTLPNFHLMDFEGRSLGAAYRPEEKEWTMDSVQDHMLILKRLGDNSPVKEGIKLVRPSADGLEMELVWATYEYVLVDVYDGYIGLRHRAFSDGLSSFLHLNTLQLVPPPEGGVSPAPNSVKFPLVCPSCPQFVRDKSISGDAWVNSLGTNYLWSYHVRRKEGYDLMLGLSDRHQMFFSQTVLSDLPKMVPQPYFQVGQQLFFLSYNKQEIVSYLV